MQGRRFLLIVTAAGLAGTGGSAITSQHAAAASSWNVVSSPDTDATSSNVFNGVTCLAADDCWAVGGAGDAPLAALNTGDGWGAVNTPTVTSAPGPGGVPHIMLIVEENKAYSSKEGSPYVIGNPDAPYLNSLASSYASATNWFSNQHNSPTDYLDLTSGTDWNLGNGGKPPFRASSGPSSLMDELNSAGIPWKGYLEELPGDCSTAGSSAEYESDHNPFVYYSDYKSFCPGGSKDKVVPWTQSGMISDLNSSDPPDFVWVTPDDCDDMHTSVSPCSSNAVAAGDTWLSGSADGDFNLPAVMNTSWYRAGGIVIITWDESVDNDTSGGSYGSGGQIPTIVVSANSQGIGNFTSSGDHYGTLRAIEEAYGVGLLNGSANASYGDLTPAFGASAASPAGPPSSASNDVQLFSVACASTSDCLAVGSDALGDNESVPIALQWNGSAWNETPLPATPSTDSELHGVTCLSSGACYAVGAASVSGVWQTLIDQWNGAFWGAMSATDQGSLSSISCAGSGFCVAVGDDDGGDGLIEQWNGTTWSSNRSFTGTDLAAVACTGSSNCWAVGDRILHFTGSWSDEGVPSGNAATLNGVSCNGANDCWAAGETGASSSNPAPLTEQYTGSSWTAIPAATGNPSQNLQAVACDSSGVNCWAVGYSGQSSSPDAYTLVEQNVQANAPPFVTGLSPAAGPTSGGQTVTVTGYGLSGITSVKIDGIAVSANSATDTSFTFSTPADSSGYADLVVTTPNGSSLADSNAGYVYEPPGVYTAITPFRILDTRFSAPGALQPGESRGLRITGGPVPGNAIAVEVNVTAVAPSNAGYLTVFPSGTSTPVASNLNFTAGEIIPNLVTVALGEGGAVRLYNLVGTTNVIVDVEGYYTAAGASVVGDFHEMPPLRVCDTRSGAAPGSGCAHAALGPQGAIAVNVTGNPMAATGSPATVPGDGSAAAVVLNVTAVLGTSNTFLSVYPTGSDGSCAAGEPDISTINLNANTTQANRVFVALGPSASGGPDTDVCVYNLSGTINLVLDANGWFGSGGASAGDTFQATGPARLCDTRPGSETVCSGSAIPANGTMHFQVTGNHGVPTEGVVAAVMNATVVAGDANTYITVYPFDQSKPNASDINTLPSQVIPNLVVVQLAASGDQAGQVGVYNFAGTTNVVFDIAGWFSSGA